MNDEVQGLIKKPEQLRDFHRKHVMHADQGEPSVSSGRGCDPHNRFRPMESPSTFLANMIRCRINVGVDP